MPESPIRKLAPLADSARKKGINIYHLNIGQPDLPTPGPVIKALREFSGDRLVYCHSQGLKSFREALAEYYSRFNLDISPETNLMVTAGGSEAIVFAMNIVCPPGGEILVPEPFYTNYNGFALMSGVKLVPVATALENDFRLPEIQVWEKLVTPRTRAVLLCHPANPTGTYYRQEEIEKLNWLARKHDLFILVDEVYREFVYDGLKPYSVLELPALKDRTIVMDSLSKRYSACGARIGCLVTFREDFIQAAVKFGQARLSVPHIEQIAMTEAVKLPSSYYQKIVREYEKRRDLIFKYLESIPGVVGHRPSGAFYCIIRLPVRDSEHFARWLLQDFESNGETVMVAPAAGFYATEGKGRDEIRLAYVLNTAELKKAMQCLKKALEVYND